MYIRTDNATGSDVTGLWHAAAADRHWQNSEADSPSLASNL